MIMRLNTLIHICIKMKCNNRLKDEGKSFNILKENVVRNVKYEESYKNWY